MKNHSIKMSTDTVTSVSSRQLEDRIDTAISSLQRQLPGIDAEFRCQVCFALQSAHKDGNVKGCNRQKLAGQEYINSLFAQCTQLEQAVTAVEKLHDFSTVEAELVACRHDIKQLEEDKKEIMDKATVRIESAMTNAQLRDDLIRKNFDEVTKLVKFLFELFQAAGDGSVNLQAAHDEFARINNFFTTAKSPLHYPTPNPIPRVHDKHKTKRSTVKFASTDDTVLFPSGLSLDTDDQTDKDASTDKPSGPKLSDRFFPETRFSDASAAGGDDAADSSSDDTSSDDDDQPNAGPPGLEEPPAGRTLVHETGGAVVGGTPNSGECKNSKYFISVKFSEDDTPTTHMRKEKNLLLQFKSHYKNSTIYTLVDVLYKQSSDISHILEPMMELEKHYTSFRHFMTDLRVRRFPNIHTACITEYVELKQGKDTAYDLYLKMLGLLRAMGRDPNQFANDYINKLAHPEVRNALSTANYDSIDLAQMAKHADRVERTLGLTSKNGGKKKGDAHISSNTYTASTSSRGVSRGNGQAHKGRGRGRGGRSGRGGRGGPTGAGSRVSNGDRAVGGASSRPAISEKVMSCLQQMQTWDIPENCFGCLSPHHTWKSKSPACSQRRCVFCGTSFTAKNGHPSASCRDRPKTKNDLQSFYDEGKKDRKSKKSVNAVSFDPNLPIAESHTSCSDSE